MTPSSSCNCLLRAASILGFLGVAMGAFGVHAPAVVARLDAPGMRHVWDTAVLYQLVHAVVLLFLSREIAPRWVGGAFAGGTVLFSGSLYILALGGGPGWLFGPLTPLGGLGFLAGWVGLFLYARGKSA